MSHSVNSDGGVALSVKLNYYLTQIWQWDQATKSNMVGKIMGFAHKRVWTMGYCGPMGYGMHFSANQVGGRPELWAMRGYVFSEVWFTRGSTVHIFAQSL